MIAKTYHCLGFSWLGECVYNPASPIYHFTVGNAVAALGFTLAVQQFLKPINIFKIEAHRLRQWHLFALIFVGAILTLLAAILPNLSSPPYSVIEYPIVWELLGAVFIIFAYALVSFFSIFPAIVRNYNLEEFVRRGAKFLAEANREDMAKFAEQLVPNIKRLMKYASFFQRAEHHSVSLEMARKKEAGEPQVIQGPPPPVSAFFEFTYRREIIRAHFAASFLRLLSDTNFCATLVTERPWLAVKILHAITDYKYQNDEVRPFIQELARQAIIQDKSMLGREIQYRGFTEVPLLKETLFGKWEILSRYQPLNSIGIFSGHELTDGLLERLRFASETVVETAMQSGDYWHNRYVGGVVRAYEDIFRQIGYASKCHVPIHAHMGVQHCADIIAKSFANMKEERYKNLFISDKDRRTDHIVDDVAEIVFDSLAAISHGFSGPDDSRWQHATILFDIFDPIRNQPNGINPLQQCLLIKIEKKLEQNARGWGRPLLALLLTVIGLNGTKGDENTAYNTLCRVVYGHLDKLAVLYKADPAKAERMLPKNIKYIAEDNTFTYEHRDGEITIIDLGKLKITPVNLYDEAIFAPRPPFIEE